MVVIIASRCFALEHPIEDRPRPRHPQDLDRLMQASTLMWIGFPGKRIAFCYAEDVDLMADKAGDADGEEEREAPKTADAVRLFADRRGRYRLTDLLGDPPRPAQLVLSRLWDGVWAGRITNDSLAALRRGLAQDFRPSPANERLFPAAPAFPAFRRRRSRLSGPASAGAVGNWYLVAQPAPVDGWVDAEEENKDRVRLLLARYGILFRHLLQRELPPFQWPAVFLTLRLMELSGEIHAGCFFEGIPGPQFISGRMRQMLREEVPTDELFWISAQDPASLCGIAIDGFRGRLPRRAAGTHLVYLGARLAMVSQRRGKILNVHLPIDHPRLGDCFSLFDHLLNRRIDAWRSITIETINGQPAPVSPLLDLLRPRFDTVIETHTVTLYRLTDS